jgi:hypothetical protein
MEKDVLSFTQVSLNNDLLTEIWKLDPRNLEHVEGIVLSSYALALSQYLIYFTYQKNLSRAEKHRLSKYINRRISLLIGSSERKFKTKAEAADYYISTETDLMDSQTKLEAIQKELMQIEGVDKAISELIATIKRELTRRENELYQVRAERRNQ